MHSELSLQPKLIMIDVDGTLVDSVPDLTFSVDATMIALGKQPWGEEHVRNWVGNGVPKLVERMLTGELEGMVNQVEYDEAYPLFLEIYKENVSRKSVIYDGVAEALDYLDNKQYIIGCVTNKARAFTHPLLKNLGLFDRFELIICGDDLERKKPDPMPLLYAANFFQVQPNECLMLGDSISDVKASRAAGFNIICMSYGYNHGQAITDAHPDAVLDSMAEIKHYL